MEFQGPRALQVLQETLGLMDMAPAPLDFQEPKEALDPLGFLECLALRGSQDLKVRLGLEDLQGWMAGRGNQEMTEAHMAHPDHKDRRGSLGLVALL